MAQTLAVLPRFAVGPLPQAPEKAMKKQAANDEDRFAGWLGETGRDESSAVRERDASGGTAGALYGIARQGAGRAKFSTGEAVDTPASKSSTEPAGTAAQPATQSQTAAIRELATFPAVQAAPLSTASEGAKSDRGPLSSARQNFPSVGDAKAGSADEGAGATPQTHFSKAQICANGAAGFAAAGVQAYIAPDMPPRFKLAQCLGRTETAPDGASKADARAPGSAANVGAASFTVTDVRRYFAPETLSNSKFAQTVEQADLGPDSVCTAEKSGAPGASNARVSPARHDSFVPEAPVTAAAKAAQPSEASAGITVPAPGQAPSPPAQQVFEAIETAMPAAVESPPAIQEDLSAPDGYRPLKSVTITLDPAELGTVAVTLSLKNDRLGVKLEVSDAGTAQLLRQDDSALTELLRSAGYTVGNLSVHVSPQQAPLADAAGQAPPNGQNTSNMPNSGSGGGQAGAQAEDGSPANKRHDRRESGYGRFGKDNNDRSLYI